MKNTLVCTFLPLILLPIVQATIETVQSLVFSNGRFPCAADSPTKVSSIEKIPSVPKCVPSSVLCSWKCHLEPNCICYNVNSAENQCQLYDYIPINFVMNTTCSYFQVGTPLSKHTCRLIEHYLCTQNGDSNSLLP